MQALKQLKILDFSPLLPGPYATMLMAEMGANVLRVESPTRPDLVKFLEPRIDGASAAYHQLHDKKTTLQLDLKQSRCVGQVKELIRDYDIVVEQFRPGVMARLGLSYEILSEINPEIIYCSITGYGQTGPYRDKAGHDINYLALSGLMDYSRRAGQSPVPLGMQVADVAGGSHHAVMAILAAVIHRQSTGEGQHIDISMTDAAFALNGMSGAAALAGGDQPLAESGWLNGGTFYDYYETSDGRYMAVGSLEPQFQARLLNTLDLEWLADECTDFTQDSQKRVKQALAEVFISQTFDYWCHLFAQTDACVEPVLTFEEAAEHPHMQHRELTRTENGIRQMAMPFRLK
ncbi:CaiB/BaiF CoA transferase family protein [Oceanospirillum sediminis]|uniref:CoA transferase n=1 Tax=Oceanospirillum sediminis TaxID=2760088 RepID=A0A839IVA1_9GAMM|nr:CaiB/BaiF CoA-transferase family protein [Oceanospirillum sediminis]MBB1488046.1 CoA transferase [Oceanospirillum sediminis]